MGRESTSFPLHHACTILYFIRTNYEKEIRGYVDLFPKESKEKREQNAARFISYAESKYFCLFCL